MESRFSKYENEGKTVSDHIANINNYIDWNFEKGLDLIEKEIKSLDELNERDGVRPMFVQKKKDLIALGKCIERVHESYHFNKDTKES